MGIDIDFQDIEVTFLTCIHKSWGFFKYPNLLLAFTYLLYSATVKKFTPSISLSGNQVIIQLSGICLFTLFKTPRLRFFKLLKCGRFVKVKETQHLHLCPPFCCGNRPSDHVPLKGWHIKPQTTHKNIIRKHFCKSQFSLELLSLRHILHFYNTIYLFITLLPELIKPLFRINLADKLR